MSEDERLVAETEIRNIFDSTLSDQIARSLRVPVQWCSPAHYFAAPTVECRAMFIAGHFYGCITLVQAVAEAISRFLLSKHPEIKVSDPTDYGVVVNALQKDPAHPVISPAAFAAFGRIRGPRKGKEDRNDYHHLTEEIELDSTKLEARAEQCLNALYEIEREVFAHTFRDGLLVLKNSAYWPQEDSSGTVRVVIRR